jgi:hypothetical protein
MLESDEIREQGSRGSARLFALASYLGLMTSSSVRKLLTDCDSVVSRGGDRLIDSERLPLLRVFRLCILPNVSETIFNSGSYMSLVSMSADVIPSLLQNQRST